MTSQGRYLKSITPTSTTTTTTSTTQSENVDSDFVVILAALLCALICVLGLVAVARCAWLRRFSGATPALSSPANKGLKKKVLRALPKTSYSTEHHAGQLSDDCAICLSDFVSGDQIRVLPQCGHGFHVGCIDTWLGSHSSCPSCRQILAVRCHKCGGGLPNSASACSAVAAAATPPVVVASPQPQASSFLP